MFMNVMMLIMLIKVFAPIMLLFGCKTYCKLFATFTSNLTDIWSQTCPVLLPQYVDRQHQQIWIEI